jgi:GMP synthase-like glutamine amidotransferase
MILVVDMNYKKDSLGYYEFVLPIVSVAETLDKCVVKHYLNVTNEDLSQCDRIILSGTTLEDNVTLNQPEKFLWLKQTQKPMLGICAGMQTIGVVFGLKLLECLEIGMTQMTTVKNNPLLVGAFKAYSLHNFSVEASGDFEVLAESETCTQVIRHKQKPIYGVLFHPEVRNPDILKRFIELKQF